MADESFVIVDSSGTEHEFPAGFDPKRAAEIVRTATRTPLEKDQADPTYLRTLHELGGAVEGIVHSPVTAIKGIAGMTHDVATGARDIWNGEVPKDAGNHLFEAAQGIYHLPQQFMDATSEERGKMLGELGGSAMMAKVAPMTPRPIARGVGTITEGTGKVMGWPARISGAHALIGGNPFGAALIAAPKYVEEGGRALKQWGEAEPAFMEQQIANFKGPTPPSIDNRPPIRIVSGQRDPLADVALSNPRTVEAFSADELRAQKVAEQAAKQATKDAQERARNVLIEQAKQGLEASPPRITERVSGTTPVGGKQSMSRTFAPPEEEFGGGGGAAPPVTPPARPLPGVVRAPDPETANPNYVPRNPVGSPVRMAPPQGAPTPPVAPAGVVEPPAAPVAPLSQEAAARAFNERFPPAGPARVEALARLANREGGPPIRIAPATQAQMDAAPAIKRTAKVPVEGNVPGSKSKQAVMSATPGLTVADAEALGINPNIKITGLTPEAIQKLLEARANRSATYRINNGMDAAATRATEREP